MAKVILGLGTNIGDRLGYLHQACDHIRQHLLQGCLYSDIYESPALLLPESPEEWNIPFLNMVISGETEIGVEELLLEVKAIERKLNRQDRGRWAPREIDVDILTYGDLSLVSDNLTVPHPEIAHRDFVLLPLLDVDANWCHPKQKWSAKEAAEKLENISAVRSHSKRITFADSVLQEAA